jgi:hypothetical protein
MAVPVKFFVEDRTMRKFLIDFVQKRFGLTLHPKSDFYQFGSWSEIAKEPSWYSESTAAGNVNLLFVDADKNFSERLDEVKRITENSHLNCDLFLLPNHSDRGNMETLLKTISTNQDVWGCYEQFEKCLESKRLLLPSLKTKIYTYAEVLTVEQDRKKDLHKDPDRDYLTSNWNLQHPALDSLYQFLSKYLLA